MERSRRDRVLALAGEDARAPALADAMNEVSADRWRGGFVEELAFDGLTVGGQWAAELKSTWREARRVGDTRRCIVELIEVTSIDRN